MGKTRTIQTDLEVLTVSFSMISIIAMLSYRGGLKFKKNSFCINITTRRYLAALGVLSSNHILTTMYML